MFCDKEQVKFDVPHSKVKGSLNKNINRTSFFFPFFTEIAYCLCYIMELFWIELWKSLFGECVNLKKYWRELKKKSF